MGRGKTIEWIEMFHELERYHQKHGDCLVPQRYSSNPRLGSWVDRQRQLYRRREEVKASPMTESRINALESLGFSWNIVTDDWDDMLSLLKNYYSVHSDYLVPARYKANPKLGRWVNTQRKVYKRLRSNNGSSVSRNGSMKCNQTLTEKRISLLESIGFNWSAKDKDSWSTMFEELQSYSSQHGHCQVKSYSTANAKLGRWVKRQRQSYKLTLEGKKSTLTPNRIALLKSIGFIDNKSSKIIDRIKSDESICHSEEVVSNEVVIRNIKSLESSPSLSSAEYSPMSDKGYSDEDSSGHEVSLSTDDDDSNDNSISEIEEVHSNGVIMGNMEKLNSPLFVSSEGSTIASLSDKDYSDEDSSRNQVSLSTDNDELSLQENDSSCENNSQFENEQSMIVETVQSISSFDSLPLPNSGFQNVNTKENSVFEQGESELYVLGKNMWRCDCCYKAFFRTQSDAWEHAVLCMKMNTHDISICNKAHPQENVAISDGESE